MRFDVDRLVTPEMGQVRVREDFGKDSPHVVFVTEAFANLQAVRRVGEIIVAVAQNAGISLLCVEARSGPLVPELYAKRRSQRGQYQNAVRLVEKGELDMLEYLVLTLDDQFEIYGVEEPAQYVKVNELMKPLIPGRDPWGRLVEALYRELHHDGLGSLSPDYAEFFRTCGTDDIGGMPSLELLIGYAQRCGAESAEMRNYQAILDTKRLEGEIDFDAANREAQELQGIVVEVVSNRHRLVLDSFQMAGLPVKTATPRDLAERLAPGGMDGLSLGARVARTPVGRLLARGKVNGASLPSTAAEVLAAFDRAFATFEQELSAAFQAQDAGHAGVGRLFNYLLELMALLNIDVRRYPNVVRYAHYLNRFLSANMFFAIEELDALKRRIIARLAETDIDRLHASLSERLALLGDMCRLQQSRGDVKRLQALAGEMGHEQICEELGQFLPDSALLRDLRDLEEDYEDRFDDTMTYYNLMITRANAMAENTLKRMYDTGRDTAILLTGGFHQETVTANLARQRVSYTVVVPMITRATSDTETKGYFNTLLRQDHGIPGGGTSPSE